MKTRIKNAIRYLIPTFVGALLGLSVLTVHAFTGDPLPGVDILVKKKPSDRPSLIEFGQPGVPGVPADFFGPGSEPFTGFVDLASDTNDDPASRIDYVEGATPADYETEMVALDLVSVDPITVNVGGVDTEFDVVVHLSGPASSPAVIPGELHLPAGASLPPGSSSFVVDSFFDVEYRIEFYEAGTGNPAGGTIEQAVRLQLEDVDLPIAHVVDGTGEGLAVLGSDGGPTQPFVYGSGGGLELGIQSVFDPVVSVDRASLSEVKSLYR